MISLGKLLTVMTIGVVASASSQVLACSPVLPSPAPIQETGETAQAFEARMTKWERTRAFDYGYVRGTAAGREAGLWDAADQIVVVRIVTINRPNDIYPTASVTLEVVRIVRGEQRLQARFSVRYPYVGSCERTPTEALHGGKPGDSFVMFAHKERLSEASLIDSLGADEANDSRTAELLGITWKPATLPEPEPQ